MTSIHPSATPALLPPKVPANGYFHQQHHGGLAQQTILLRSRGFQLHIQYCGLIYRSPITLAIPTLRSSSRPIPVSRPPVFDPLPWANTQSRSRLPCSHWTDAASAQPGLQSGHRSQHAARSPGEYRYRPEESTSTRTSTAKPARKAAVQT